MELEVMNLGKPGLEVKMQDDSSSYQDGVLPSHRLLNNGEDISSEMEKLQRENPHPQGEALTSRSEVMNPLGNVMNLTLKGGVTLRSRDMESASKTGKREPGMPLVGKERQLLMNTQADFHLPRLKSPEDTFLSRKDERKRVHRKVRQLAHQARPHEDPEFDVNPDPVPFLPQNFMSSTVLKKVSIPKRHLDTFGGIEYNYSSKRGVILHTDRYKWDTLRPLDSVSQRERLLAELEYMEKLRGIKRRREVLPHRAQLNLFMGGKKIEMEERFDIQREIQKLKALVLPDNAKDLYHGRGIKLPENHSSMKPRTHLDLSMEDDVSASAPASLHGLSSRLNFDHDFNFRQPSQPTYLNNGAKYRRTGQLPSINSRSYNTGVKPEMPQMRSQGNPLPKVDNTMHRNPASWVDDQNRIMLEGHDITKSSKRDKVKVPMPEEVETEEEPNIEPESEMEVDKDETVNILTPASPAAPPPTIAEQTRTTLDISPLKVTTPHPLKGTELVTSVPENERDELRQTFERLDTDMDGHIKFHQLKSQLPEDFSQTQERFVKQVYDITSTTSTFFGVDEFLTMTQLTKTVANLSGDAKIAYQKLDFDSLENAIKKYVELFQSVDRNNRGTISLDSLQAILSTALEIDLKKDDELWEKLIDSMGLDKSSQVSKIDFLAHLPYFLSLCSK